MGATGALVQGFTLPQVFGECHAEAIGIACLIRVIVDGAGQLVRDWRKSRLHLYGLAAREPPETQALCGESVRSREGAVHRGGCAKDLECPPRGAAIVDARLLPQVPHHPK